MPKKPANDLMPSDDTRLALVEQANETIKGSLADVNVKLARQHDKFNDTHNEINLMRLDLNGIVQQLSHVVEDQKEVKEVVKHNTAAWLSVERVLNRLVTERETERKAAAFTLKTIVKITGCIVAGVGVLFGAYKAFIAILVG